MPKFSTRADSPAEADTATRLVELARTSRNIEIGHTVAEAYAPALVATSDLRHRARELMTRYDFTFGSTYLLRPPVAPWPGTVPGPNVGGAVGGIAASTWIPREWPNDDALSRDDLLRAFGAALGRQIRLDFQTPMLRRRLDMLLYDLADRAQELGLRGSQALHWTYLITRQRAWSSASHNLHQVTPLLTPEFLQVAFAMTLREKRDTIVHRELTERLLPEWSGIPWIKNMAGVARADMPQVWDGNGVAVLENLLERPACGLTAMLDRDALRAALRRAKAGAGTGFDGSALRVFTMLSVASDLFGEMNDEIRRESSRMQQAITVHESDTVHRPARHRLRRRIAARMPKQIRHAIRSVRARSEQAPEPAGTAPAR